MRRSSKPLPKDPNKLAYEIAKLSTEEEEEGKPKDSQEAAQKAISAYLSLIGKKGGLKGGPARAKKLSARKRKEIAEAMRVSEKTIERLIPVSKIRGAKTKKGEFEEETIQSNTGKNVQVQPE